MTKSSTLILYTIGSLHALALMLCFNSIKLCFIADKRYYKV